MPSKSGNSSKMPTLIDSIALEALSSKPAFPAHPGLELDDTHSVLGPREVQFRGLNQDREAAADVADAGDERIDEYCDRRRLDVRSRIELFIQVCNAVHVAHQHAIIHGDLNAGLYPGHVQRRAQAPSFRQSKPRGRWLICEHDTEGDSTGESGAAGSSQYSRPSTSAPEQVTGETVTTASDVYALGVIFYEAHDRAPALSFQDTKRFRSLASDL